MDEARNIGQGVSVIEPLRKRLQLRYAGASSAHVAAVEPRDSAACPCSAKYSKEERDIHAAFASVDTQNRPSMIT